MTLQKAVFLAIISCWGMMLLSGIALFTILGINYFRGYSFSPLPFGIAIVGLQLVRAMLSFWLRRLGGIPQEFVRK